MRVGAPNGIKDLVRRHPEALTDEIAWFLVGKIGFRNSDSCCLIFDVLTRPATNADRDAQIEHFRQLAASPSTTATWFSSYMSRRLDELRKPVRC